MKYKLKKDKSASDIPKSSKLLKYISSSLTYGKEVDLEIIPKTASEFLEEVSPVGKSKKESIKDKGDK